MRETQSERVDDIPVIVHWLEQMQIERLIDRELPLPHGNRRGCSLRSTVSLIVNLHNYPSRSPTLCCGILGQAAPSNFRDGNGMEDRNQRRDR